MNCDKEKCDMACRVAMKERELWRCQERMELAAAEAQQLAQLKGQLYQELQQLRLQQQQQPPPEPEPAPKTPELPANVQKVVDHYNRINKGENGTEQGG